jgi:SRSO17 transposase
MQRLLCKARFDVDAIRDDLAGFVAERLGEDDGVLILDETGFVKKGRASVGVARQYSGTAGRIENSQIAVFAAYASSKGHALVDRELYLTKDWSEDPPRCEAAGAPAERITAGMVTKPPPGAGDDRARPDVGVAVPVGDGRCRIRVGEVPAGLARVA